jgi:hypothetical protein
VLLKELSDMIEDFFRTGEDEVYSLACPLMIGAILGGMGTRDNE